MRKVIISTLIIIIVKESKKIRIVIAWEKHFDGVLFLPSPHDRRSIKTIFEV